MNATHVHTAEDALTYAAQLARRMTPLGLLRKIDRTVDVLGKLSRKFGDKAAELHQIAEKIAAEPVIKGRCLDKDRQISRWLRKQEAELKDAIATETIRRMAIDKDKRLSSEHRVSLHESYEEWMIALVSYYEGILQIRCEISNYNLAATDWDKLPAYDSAKDAIAALHKRVAHK